ncbi:MAG TPA: CHAT domain-containing protein [Ktedonobacteraceae bacterium]|jgi:CHAT domain-containing protein
MQVDHLLAAVCQSPGEGKWTEILEPLLKAHTRSELEELARQVKSPQAFDRLLAVDPPGAAKIARFLIALGHSTRSDLITAFGLLAQGDIDRQEGWPEKAMQHHQEAADRFRRGGDQIGWARAQGGWLAAAINSGHIDESDLMRFEQVRQVFQDAGQAYRLAVLEQTMGVAFAHLGSFNQALVLYEQALVHCPTVTRADQHIRAGLLANMANVLLWLGNTRRAHDLHRHARDAFAQLGSTVAVAHQDYNLCMVERLRGNYREALRAAQDAREGFLQASEPRDAASAAMSQVEILLLLNRSEEALLNAKRAVAILLAHQGERIDLVKALTVLARTFAKCRKGAEAFLCLEQAEKMAQKTSYPLLKVLVVIESAHLLLTQGRAAEAREVALGILKTHNTKEPTFYSGLAYLVAAEAALAQRKIAWARQVAQMIVKKHTSLETPELMWRAHVLLAEIAVQEGRSEEACRHYDAAITHFATIARTLVLDQRAEFLEDKDRIFLAALAVALKAGDYSKALLYLEQDRASADWVAWSMGQVGEDVHLAALLSRFRAASQSLTDTSSTSALKEPAWQIRNQQEAQTLWQPMNLPSISTPLNTPSNTTTLAYALLEQDLIIFALREGAVTARRVPDGTRQLRDQAQFLLGTDIARFPQQVAELNAPNSSQTAPYAPLIERFQRRLKRLWSLLIAPVTDLLPPPNGTLRLIPHGRIHALPLAALYDGSRYLMEHWDVQILPSCYLGASSPSGVAEGRPPLALGYALGGQLPRAEEEARDIGTWLQGEVWAGKDARGERLLREGSGRPYLHIAAHGAHRLDLPQSSFVVMADGNLHPIEIRTLNLQGCKLVTLSACETGLGTSRGGDAQLGLVRAFKQAGVEAVLATLWRVDDASAHGFMKQFYQCLVTGSSPSTALSQTQRTILYGGTPLHAHPYFWAGYQLTTFVLGSKGPQ